MDNPTSDQPYTQSRVLSTKMDPDLHKALRELATAKDMTVSAIIRKALINYIAQGRLASQGHQ